MASLKETYRKSMASELKKELGLENVHAVPKLEKAVLNVGLGRMSQQANFKDKILPEIERELMVISGQKPAARPAKKSIAGFKLREGQIIGLSITLRGDRMFDFIEKLNKSVFPRVRDFKGVDLKNIDKQGNLNLGFKEHVVFPEVSQDVSAVNFGLQITFVARNVQSKEDAALLYRKLGFLFKKNKA
jgi:large subunit ribosomal protein L5